MALEWLTEPLQYGFMVRALLGTTLIGILAAVIGTFVVLKGIAFIGDALAHASFAGLAFALVAGFHMHVGAMGAAMLTALGVTAVRRTARVRYDTALAILFTGAFAVGTILLATQPSFAGELTAILLGSVMAVSPTDVLLIALTVLIVACLFYMLFHRLVFVAFDPVGAEAAKMPVGMLEALFMLMVSAAVVVSIQAIGVILVVALLITPPATAGLLTKRLPRIIALASLLATLAIWIGLYLSYYLAAPAGSMVVLVATV